MTERIFLSSTQKEFAKERMRIKAEIENDAFLGDCFEVILFENTPAVSKIPIKACLDEVEKSSIYMGLFGKEYGGKYANGLSATEQELNHATKRKMPILIFIDNSKKIEIKKLKYCWKKLIRKLLEEILIA